ncbi:MULTISPECIES: PAS domain-containing protein [unclassified Pseudomonas]|uniref:hybrid sensor histidine kinase/response regulator n=1 Tax=unclassified Pseudomonas TaxID=196821 RepID=UPI0035C0D8A6
MNDISRSQGAVPLPRNERSRVYDSELRFRALVIATSTMVYRMSADWKELRELTGKGFLEEVTEPSTQWLETYVAVEDRPAVVAAINKAIQQKSVFELEHRIKLPDGSSGWTESRAVPIFGDAGEIVEWFGAASDVTERHRANARLRESEDAFKALADSLPDLVWITDRAGNFEFVNRRWRDYFGPDALTANGNLMARNRIHPEDFEHSSMCFQTAVATQTPFTTEHRLLGRDGKYRWYVIKANPYLDPEAGKTLRWYGTSVNVQRQHEAEDQLRGLNQQLECQIAEGTRELEAAENQVRQLQKLEALGQLTGGVAHDFNNMLTVIRNAADLMQLKTLTEEKQHFYLKLILATADRAAKITGRLLAFSRKQVLRPEVFPVADRVEEVAEMLQQMVGDRVDIAVDTGATDRYVQADPNQFETALMNLVVNARDAMEDEGKIEITVTEAARTDTALAAEGVNIAVSDTGHGIDPNRLQQIFEPFYTTKDLGKGTGLGLAQVHGFAQQSGGQVSVKSTVGEGSIFTVTLPIVKQPLNQPDKDVNDSKTPCIGKILIVEDNPEVADFTANMLSELGFDSLIASDGSSALCLLENADGCVDFVFSDVVMPGISGIELAQAIRKRWPCIGVVLTSGYGQALSEEVSDTFPVLAKPYSVTRLLNALNRVGTR